MKQEQELTRRLASIYLAIYKNRYAALLKPDVTKAVEAAGLPSSSLTQLFEAMTNGTAAALNAVPGYNATINAAMVDGRKTAYATSFADTYLTSIAFGAIALVSILLVKNDMDSKFTDFLNKSVAHVGKPTDEADRKKEDL